MYSYINAYVYVCASFRKNRATINKARNKSIGIILPTHPAAIIDSQFISSFPYLQTNIKCKKASHIGFDFYCIPLESESVRGKVSIPAVAKGFV